MYSFLRSMFFVCSAYCSLVHAGSSSPIASAPYSHLSQISQQYLGQAGRQLFSMGIPLSIILKASRQAEVQNQVKKSSMRSAFNVLKGASGWLYAGFVFLKGNVGPLANFLAKYTSELQAGAVALGMAALFWRVRALEGQVETGFADTRQQIASVGQQVGLVQIDTRAIRETQQGHTTQLGNLQTTADTLKTELTGLGEQVGGVRLGLNDLAHAFREQQSQLKNRFDHLDDGIFCVRNRIDDGILRTEEMRYSLGIQLGAQGIAVGRKLKKISGNIQEVNDKLQRLGILLQDQGKNQEIEAFALREDVNRQFVVQGKKLDMIISSLASSSQPSSLPIDFDAANNPCADILRLASQYARGQLLDRTNGPSTDFYSSIKPHGGGSRTTQGLLH